MHMNEVRIYVLFMYNAWPCSPRSLTMSYWDRQSLSSLENQLGDKQVHISFAGREAISLSLDFLGQGKLTTELCPFQQQVGQMLLVLASLCLRCLTSFLFFFLTWMVLICWVLPTLFAHVLKLSVKVYILIYPSFFLFFGDKDSHVPECPLWLCGGLLHCQITVFLEENVVAANINVFYMLLLRQVHGRDSVHMSVTCESSESANWLALYSR